MAWNRFRAAEFRKTFAAVARAMEAGSVTPPHFQFPKANL
jgi:hypothetical protein